MTTLDDLYVSPQLDAEVRRVARDLYSRAGLPRPHPDATCSGRDLLRSLIADESLIADRLAGPMTRDTGGYEAWASRYDAAHLEVGRRVGGLLSRLERENGVTD